MLLAISIMLALVCVALKPLGDGLYDTSLWVAKITMEPDITAIADNDTVKVAVKTKQAALMDGWLSNIPFFGSIAFFSSLVVAFFYHWWFAVLMYFMVAFFGVLANIIFGRAVSYYLLAIYHKLVNRTANYKVQNDQDRVEAGEVFCKELEEILIIYQGSGLRPPSAKQLKGVPYGDRFYWLEQGQAQSSG